MIGVFFSFILFVIFCEIFVIPVSGNKDNVAVADYREMVKTLVCGVKTITWGAGSCKVSTGGNDIA